MNNQYGCQDYYNTTRRNLLKGAGAASLATFLGMPVRDLVAAAPKAATAEHVILFWNGGGMSHIDTWDPKPGRPTAGPFKPIKTSASGVEISELFPKTAEQMHHAALIRSIAGTNGDHGRATYELQTSYQMTGNSTVHPGLGSIVVSQRDSLGDLPAFVSIGGRAPKAGYLGQTCEAYYVGRPGERDPYLTFPDGISQVQGNKRLDILAKMNLRKTKQLSSTEMKAAEVALNDAVDLMKSPALAAFELEKEDPKVLARYGETEFGRAALLSKKLVETGVRFVQVNRGGFDNHSNIEDAMNNHGATMDPALASLIEDLSVTGMIDKTLIVMLSEFGRTPRVNDNAGRDHWARVFSCFMAGGGIKGGTVIGSSDEDGAMPDENPVQVSDLHATVLHAMGINPKHEITTPQGRPMTLVRKEAKPIVDMFA
ncbi:MAG: DUF1501 domain-containing protein [Verrucomicrobiales bacterium]|nr:DUF1501 domain-containing protein [Verrucomicrobiales bacterium]